MQFRSVHAVDAVFDYDRRVVANIGGRGGGEHAGIGIYAGDQQGVDAVRTQQKIEVGAKEAVVALLGVDDEVSGVEQLRHHRTAGPADDIVAHRVLAGRGRILGASTPERVGADFVRVPVRRHQVDHRNAGAAAPVEQPLVGR